LALAANKSVVDSVLLVVQSAVTVHVSGQETENRNARFLQLMQETRVSTEVPALSNLFWNINAYRTGAGTKMYENPVGYHNSDNIISTGCPLSRNRLLEHAYQ